MELVKVQFDKSLIVKRNDRLIKFHKGEVYTLTDCHTYWKYGSIQIPSHVASLCNSNRTAFLPETNSQLKPFSITCKDFKRKLDEVGYSRHDEIEMDMLFHKQEYFGLITKIGYSQSPIRGILTTLTEYIKSPYIQMG